MGIFSEMDMDTKVAGATAQEPTAEPLQEQPISAETTPTAPAKTESSEDDSKRAAHEASEAKRKAEWEAKQQAKKTAEETELLRISNMTDEDVMASSMKRISDDTERLTRRNMKDCIAEYIQTLCLSDPDFARKALHPRKSMIHCIWFINRKAREYVEQEMKDNDMKPDQNGIYGCDVPDDLCYQWAEEYFKDPDAKEDHTDEEKFVPKPYVGGRAKGKPKKQPVKKQEAPVKKAPANEDQEQITLGDYGMMEESA